MGNTPKPLTQCQPPSIDWSRPNTPIASDFDDIYFSTDGGINETRMVFLEGCGLPQGWLNRPNYTIGELGFGSGLNFLTAWQMWDKTSQPTSRLDFISIEKHPFNTAELEKALSLWPELAAYAAQLIDLWPQRVKGFHRLHFGRVTLTLIHDDITPALKALDARVDAWFLDGFNPIKNPDMWSAETLEAVASLSASNARLATFTVAKPVKDIIEAAGFKTEKKTGFGRKRHRLEARLISPLPPAKTQKLPVTPVIIGCGIGGASFARAFMRRGIKPRIISRGNKYAASGNAAALIKPRLDLQDRPESRFFLASYLYALQAYAETNGIISRGVTHYPKTNAEALRFEKLARQAPLDSAHLGFENNTLTLPQSLTISPKDVIAQWTQGIEVEPLEVTDLNDIDGPSFAAIGYGIKPFLTDGPALRFSRGQISWAQGTASVPNAISYGGYALPAGDKLLLGATHDRLGDNDPYQITAKDDLRNFAQFESIMGYKLNPTSSNAVTSRASVRVTTANTLPMILNPKLDTFVLTGLGSRGFVFAPLLAETIVSHWLGEVLPIDKQVWTRFGPR